MTDDQAAAGGGPERTAPPAGGRGRRRFGPLALGVGAAVVAAAVAIPLVLVNQGGGASGDDGRSGGTGAMRYTVLTPTRASSPQTIATIQGILRERLTGIGIAHPDVRAGASAILVGVPAGRENALGTLTATGRLTFREVHAADSAGTGRSGQPLFALVPADAAGRTPPALQTRYEAFTCPPAGTGTSPAVDDHPTSWVITCDPSRNTKYALKPAKVVGTDVRTATVTHATSVGPPVGPSPAAGADFIVTISFTGAGQRKFTALTEEATGKQVAVTLDDVVRSAPTINERIPGDAQISGNFSRSEAENLASVLRSGALPVPLRSSPVTSAIPTPFA